jgi:hypothetical protein
MKSSSENITTAQFILAPVSQSHLHLQHPVAGSSYLQNNIKPSIPGYIWEDAGAIPHILLLGIE